MEETKCPRCGKVHKSLRPALMCLHAWQNLVEVHRGTVDMDKYMVLQRIVRRLGG